MASISFQRTINDEILMVFTDDSGSSSTAAFEEGLQYDPAAVFQKLSQALELLGSEKAKLYNAQ